MSDHDNDTCPHLVRASLLEAENARLKADVGELADALKLASEVGIKIADEVTRLKAEVERLKAYNEEALAHIAKEERKSRECLDMEQAENARLKAELEETKDALFKHSTKNHRLQVERQRLTKAGDALYESEIGYYGEQILENMKHHSGELCRNWKAAKEGKPSV